MLCGVSFYRGFCFWHESTNIKFLQRAFGQREMRHGNEKKEGRKDGGGQGARPRARRHKARHKGARPAVLAVPGGRVCRFFLVLLCASLWRRQQSGSNPTTRQQQQPANERRKSGETKKRDQNDSRAVLIHVCVSHGAFQGRRGLREPYKKVDTHEEQKTKKRKRQRLIFFALFMHRPSFSRRGGNRPHRFFKKKKTGNQETLDAHETARFFLDFYLVCELQPPRAG